MDLSTCAIDQTKLDRASSPRSQIYLAGSGGPDTYVVSGDTGTKYTVVLDTTHGKCTCPDFTNRGKPCKHMYWIALRVLRAGGPSTGTWDAWLGTTALPVAPAAPAPHVVREFADLKTILGRITSETYAQRWKLPKLETDTLCPICLDPMVPLAANDRVHWCRFGCGNVIHESCGKHLLTPACPCCRHPDFYINPTRFGH